MTIEDAEFKVPATSALNDDCTPDDKLPPSSSNPNWQTCKTKRVESLKSISAERLLVFHTDFNNKPDILMLLDSGASNYYFADLSLFTSCHKLHLAISPSILWQFSQSQWLQKALEKTFWLIPVISRGNQYWLRY